MPTTSEVVKRYFTALANQDLEGAVACWAPGGVDRFVGQQELLAPDGIREYFTELFSAFPDFRFEIVDLTTQRERCAVRWKVEATFAGPGRFQGFAPNGARARIEGCDVVTVRDGLIVENYALVNEGDIARQLGFLPPVGSPVQARMAGLANTGTRVRGWLRGHGEPEWIAEGVWLVRGGRPRTMNVYLIEDEGGVTMFDAGISQMAGSLASACARLGGLRRIVLGHADADHRGAAPSFAGAPVLCHPLEREAAESDAFLRPYHDLSKLPAYARPVYPALLRSWDGGAVRIAGTLVEGDEVAGFRVVELPGHAPGLFGLFRESDRLALCSDTLYTIDPATSRRGPAHVPHPAFNADTEQARESIRKLASLNPAIVWAGHADPVSGDVAGQLAAAAAS